MPAREILINRAPVLTLWATVVAMRLGLDEGEALSLAKCLTGLTAQSKGRRLGIYEPAAQGAKKVRELPRGEQLWVEVCGRPIPAMNTESGIRAVTGSKPIDPGPVRLYLGGKFGDSLEAARRAMEKLAAVFEPKDLEARAFSLYEKFRPAIPAGVRGWGAKGTLDLDLVEALARGG